MKKKNHKKKVKPFLLPKGDPCIEPLMELEELFKQWRQGISQAFGIVLYIYMIPDLLKMIDELDADRRTKALAKQAVFFPLMGIDKRVLKKTLKTIMKQKKKESHGKKV